MSRIESIPIGTLHSDGCHRHGRGMGASLLLLARDCTLARRAIGRHSFPLLYSWGDRQSRRLAELRWIFEHLPFFGVQTEKLSMQAVSPRARALMWSAGVTSSAIIPTLGALWAWFCGVPESKLFFLFALFWAVGTLASNWTSRTGDYSKARRALGHV